MNPGHFDGFYASTAQQTLLVTYALCGDRTLALESTLGAYRSAAADWEKVSVSNPLGTVRSEAWRLTSVNRTAHPLRRAHEDDADTELLDAIHELPINARRLLVLLTLGDSDLDVAADEVQVTSEEGIELATEALTTLEQALRVPIDEIENRLRALGEVTSSLEMPTVKAVRKRALQIKVRNTWVMAVGAVIAILGLGAIVAEGGFFESAANIADRHTFSQAEINWVHISRSFTTDQLLELSELRGMDPTVSWSEAETEVDTNNDWPYATCPTDRFANSSARRTFVRIYEGIGEDDEQHRLVQAVEISGSNSAATRASQSSAAYETMLRWFAECQHPRVQMINAYTVESPTGTFDILRLRSYRDEVRTFTVALSRGEGFNVALVHETDGTNGPSEEAFAALLMQALSKACERAGVECSTDFEVFNAVPPVVSDAPEFLTIVDLPPVGNVDSIWDATTVGPAGSNPVAELCEIDVITQETDGQAREFLMPEATQLPDRFGLTQVVFTFRDAEEAEDWTRAAIRGVNNCPETRPSVTIVDSTELSRGSNVGHSWLLELQVDEDTKAQIRVGMVRRGSAVSQVTLTPIGTFDLTDDAFVSLVERSGQRLQYAE